MQEPIASVPVHLVTGFLGGGKSTLIHRLIEQKPAEERWVVVINEFGRVGIDQAMFAEREGLVIAALPGGCLCCQLAMVMRATLVKLLHRHRPDRVIIEPSGLGHPAGLVEVLHGDAFQGVLELRDIIAVLDPRRLDDPRVRDYPTFRDQLAMADALVLTMPDLATLTQLEAARDLARCHWPPLRWFAQTAHGDLPLTLLLESGEHVCREGEQGRAEHSQAAADIVILDDLAVSPPEPGRPVRESGASLGHATLGWRWDPDDLFDRDLLTAMLDALPDGLRVKGVLHTRAGWTLYNRVEEAGSLSETAWRRDSRLEIIGESGFMPARETLEKKLQACLLA
jgi:G3E family GTPase